MFCDKIGLFYEISLKEILIGKLNFKWIVYLIIIYKSYCYFFIVLIDDVEKENILVS